MKKNIVLSALILVTLFSFSFISCKSNEDDIPGISETIVGTWVYNNNNHYEEITFNDDNTFADVVNDGKSRERYNGTYSVNEDKLTIRWEEHEKWDSNTSSWLKMVDNSETIVITIYVNGKNLIILEIEGELNISPMIYTRYGSGKSSPGNTSNFSSALI